MSNKAAPQFPYKVDILYEDADCAALNKPAGLMVHPDGRSSGPFLTDWIKQTFPGAVGVGESARGPAGEELERFGIVHRLDRETSGVLLIAKTQTGFESLKQQFQDRTVEKKYLAFVWGELKEEFGTITRPIGRSGSDFRKWSAQPGARGEIREAETYWTRLWTGKAEVAAEGGAESGASRPERFSLIRAEPKTGRTHQIRVHFMAIHHPVVGDRSYAVRRPPALGFERTALHSWSVEFADGAGKRVSVRAPLPEDFTAACAALEIKL